MWELPPNGQGIAALQILNLLEGYDIGSMGFGSADYIHHFVEAKLLLQIEQNIMLIWTLMKSQLII